MTVTLLKCHCLTLGLHWKCVSNVYPIKSPVALPVFKVWIVNPTRSMKNNECKNHNKEKR